MPEMSKKWVYTHMEYDRANNTSYNPIIPMPDVKCQDDAIKKGTELWRERLKGCDDNGGAKRVVKDNGNYFWPSKPIVRLEISIPTDPL